MADSSEAILIELDNDSATKADITSALINLAELWKDATQANFMGIHGAAIVEKLVVNYILRWAPYMLPEHRASITDILFSQSAAHLTFFALAEALTMAKVLRNPGASKHLVLLVTQFCERRCFLTMLTSWSTNGDLASGSALMGNDLLLNERIASTMLSIPNRIANMLGCIGADKQFNIDCDAYVQQLGEAVAVAVSRGGNLPIIHIALLGKACFLQNFSLFLSPILHVLASLSCSSTAFKLFSVPDRAVEHLCRELVKYIAAGAHHWIMGVLVDLVNNHRQYRFVLTEKFLYSRYFKETSVAVAIVELLVMLQLELTTFDVITHVWGSQTVLDDCSYLHQFYLTKIVLLLQQRLSAQECSQYMMSIVAAVPRFIQHTESNIRMLGMLTAVVFTGRVSTNVPVCG